MGLECLWKPWNAVHCNLHFRTLTELRFGANRHHSVRLTVLQHIPHPCIRTPIHFRIVIRFIFKKIYFKFPHEL